MIDATAEMPFKKKRKASAIESAAANSNPPAKRGRPSKAKDEPVVPTSAVETPKRGRPKKVESETAVTSQGKAQASQITPKKAKPNSSATRTSKRLSDGLGNAPGPALGPQTRRASDGITNQGANGNGEGSVIAVKKAKPKTKGKAKAAKKKPAVSATETIPVSSFSSSKWSTRARRSIPRDTLVTKPDDDAKGSRSSNVSVNVPSPKDETSEDEKADDEAEDDGPNYWLMKAEPESRVEKGKDVKFSIDDLRAAVEPEGWDGVRNPTARNNMRMMLKGDLAFFYHSNCKVPGIAGVMEVVQEHSSDESAFDPSHPYYDPKSTPENPKWCKVHVAFRQKFAKLIKLKELQKYAKDGGVLQDMQTLRQSRLSVSKVTKKEWDFIMDLVEEFEEDPALPAPEARMFADSDAPNGATAPHAIGKESHSVANADTAIGQSGTEILNGTDTQKSNQPQDVAERLREQADPLEHFHDNVIENSLATMLPDIVFQV